LCIFSKSAFCVWLSVVAHIGTVLFRKLILLTTLSLCSVTLIAQDNPAPESSQSDSVLQTSSPDATATTQSPTPANPEHELLRVFVHDEYRMWTSPFRAHNYSSHTMEKYGIPFILLSASLIGTDRQTATLLPNRNSQVVWSGRISQAGATYTLAGFTGLTYLVGRFRTDSHEREAGLLGMEAVAHTGIIVEVLKELAQRERPLEGNQHGRFWKGGSSFPSGHSAESFAVATVFAYEYRQHIAVPITAYSAASLIAFSRLSGRRHWASDIFVGSSTGFLIGRYLYRHHHNPELPGSPVQSGNKLLPDLNFTRTGIALQWAF
jgi:membrane-associated phospholipid phosphatase